jgi:NodT family efflux transporter outer membrane factor (OMF) lipoprotein
MAARHGRALPVLMAVLLPALLCACALQGPYQRPAILVAPAWANAQPADGPSDAAAPEPRWWSALGDPAIDRLVAQAMAGNPSLGEALARVDQAAAQVASDGAARLPRADFDAAFTRAQVGDVDTTGSALSIEPLRQSSASIGPRLSWELDLWGRLRNRREAALARLDARQADAAAARISVAAQIADAVVALRSCRASLRIREDDLTSRTSEVAIAQRRLALGNLAPADVATTRTELANARTDRIMVEAQCLRQRDAIVALTGTRAAVVDTEIDPNDTYNDMAAPPPTRLALPATILATHPAVVAAERELAARWSEIGAARADRLPRLSLTAALSGQWLGALGSSGSYTGWSAGPALTMPVFDGGLGKAQVRAAQARYRESLAALTGALRTAARDVEDALADRQSADARVETSAQAVAAARLAMRANEARWRAGALSAFDLETSRRALNTARLNAVTAHADRARAWIALVRASGGAVGTNAAQTGT